MASPFASNSYIFCPPPPGKPNPNLSWDHEWGADARPRVVQKGQKGPTCLYYACNTIRERIGKHPLLCQRKERLVEKYSSWHRKACTEIESTLYWRVHFAEEMIRASGKEDVRITQKVAQKILDNDLIRAANERDLVQSFCQQNEDSDLISYAKKPYLQARLSNARELLKRFSMPDEEIESVLTLVDQACSTTQAQSILLNRLIPPAYGLQQSAWHPLQPINSLIKELTLYGPHVVQGSFGRGCYKYQPLLRSKQIEGRDILYWSTDSWIGSLIRHAIVIVGACAKGKGSVYFIDPNDGSDPADKKTQILYLMSYKRLQSSIVNIYGYIPQKSDGTFQYDGIEAGENLYAWHAKRPRAFMPQQDQTLP